MRDFSGIGVVIGTGFMVANNGFLLPILNSTAGNGHDIPCVFMRGDILYEIWKSGFHISYRRGKRL